MDAQRGIARRMVIGLPPEGLSPAWEKDFAGYPPAGVILFRRDFADLEALRRLTTHLRALARPRRLFIGMDEEGGFVSQLDGHLPVPPNARLLARAGGPAEVEAMAHLTGMRLRSLGVDWVFAPVADVNIESRNPVIGPRAFGSDPAHVSQAVGAALRGYRAARLVSCLKHFPGHGDTVLDSHLALPRCPADRATLEARELGPFREHLAHADTVMTAHVVYPALDPDAPATFSRPIAHDLLRDTLGFNGVSITDALEMKGAAEGRTPVEIAALAFAAGCDLLLFAFHDERMRRVRLDLAKMLADGRLAREGHERARPRLARLDREVPEPTREELARPLAELTPPGFEEHLERLAAQGLEVQGTPPGVSGAWRVTEPPFAHGDTLAVALGREGVPVVDAAAAAGAGDIVAVSSRIPLDEVTLADLRAGARERPTVLIGLQADAFLDQVPEAAVRISACDATPATRRAVARTVAAVLAGRNAD